MLSSISPYSLHLSLRATYLLMIHKVKPRQHMQPHTRIPRIPTRDPLHIRRQTTLTIQRLPFLYFIHHLPHIHLLLPFVFPEAVEPHFNCSPLVLISCSDGLDWGPRTGRPLSEVYETRGHSNRAR